MTREEAIEQLKWYFECDDGVGSDSSTKKAYELALEALKEEPRINAKWVRWWDLRNGYESGTARLILHAKCGNCGTEFSIGTLSCIKFCSQCGAKMDGEE